MIVQYRANCRGNQFDDFAAGLGERHINDAAVIAALIATLGANIKRRHRDQAEEAVERLRGG